MYQVVTMPKAIEMALEAYDWYELQKPGLGKSFLLEVTKCIGKLEDRPAAYPKIKKNMRQINLDIYPYVPVIEILNSDVVVYTVFHTSLNPKKKFKK